MKPSPEPKLPPYTVYAGWKIQTAKDTFTQVKGEAGGSKSLSIPRDASYQGVLERFQEKFFPGGVSPVTNQKFTDLHSYVATNQGLRLPTSTVKFQDWRSQLKSSPLRLYLYTYVVICILFQLYVMYHSLEFVYYSIVKYNFSSMCKGFHNLSGGLVSSNRIAALYVAYS